MKPETRSFYEQAVQRTIDEIVGNLDEALDLETLASGACMSPFHFHRMFRGMVGETPLELVRRLRMERAARQVLANDRPITQIAFDAGYETHESFTRAFRVWYLTSPSGFRHRKRARTEIVAPCGVHFGDNPARPFIPRDSGGKAMTVDIKVMPELRVAAVRHVGPYNLISQAFERLGSIVDHLGVFARPETMMVGIYHDDPDSTPPDQLRSDAGLVAPEGMVLPEGLTEQRIPAGRYASAVHVGPYEQLGDAWARFFGEWLPASGHRLGPGVSYEIYRNTPMEVPKEQLRTEIYIPIA
jgi:AraC family transcriptional regulator